MMKGKKFIVFLVAVSMMLVSMFSGLPVSAASETEADTVFAEAELMGKKTCTIKKKNSRYYYVNAKGKTVKKKGWQKNAGGDYTYFVGSKGYVTAKITNGNYYKWKSGRFVRTSLSKYKGKTVKIKGKIFYVKTNGKISKTKGWKKNVSGVYAYYVNGNGVVSEKITGGIYKKWKNGKWKAESIIDSLVFGGDACLINGRYFYVNTNGKIVTSKGWKKNAFGTYTYYVSANGSITEKLSWGVYKRYASGKFTKKSLAAYKGQTIKIHGLSVAVSEDGTASVVEKTQAADDNNHSSDNNNNQSEEHVHRWSFKDENGNILEDTNYVQHPEEYHYEDVITVPAWDEPVREERAVCKTCGAIFPTYLMDGLDGWDEHVKETHHGNFEYTNVIVSYIHHDDVWGEEKVVDKEAWWECDYNYRCTVCGDMMKIHYTRKDGIGVNVAEKSGIILDYYGNYVQTITAGVPF